MKKLILPVLFISFFNVQSQNNPLTGFDKLIGQTWVIEGEWANGSTYKTERNFQYGLNRTLIIAKAKGFTSQDQSTYGDRNFGVTRYNPEDSTVAFYEFDVFGGLTVGDVKIEGNDVNYVYQYNGEILADIWKYVEDGLYMFYVVKPTDGEPEIYLEAEARPIKRTNAEPVR